MFLIINDKTKIGAYNALLLQAFKIQMFMKTLQIMKFHIWGKYFLETFFG